MEEDGNDAEEAAAGDDEATSEDGVDLFDWYSHTRYDDVVELFRDRARLKSVDNAKEATALYADMLREGQRLTIEPDPENDRPAPQEVASRARPLSRAARCARGRRRGSASQTS
jgi:hypothetical protein